MNPENIKENLSYSEEWRLERQNGRIKGWKIVKRKYPRKFLGFISDAFIKEKEAITDDDINNIILKFRVKKIKRVSWKNEAEIFLTQGKKRCSLCSVVKDIYKDFARDAKKSDGAFYCCKLCQHKKEILILSDDKKRTDLYIKNSDAKRARRKKYKDVVMEYYGERCACCGESNREFLCIDHVNGDGRKQRRIDGISSSDLPKYIIDSGFPSSYRILCHNCNMSLGIYGYCPHGNVDPVNYLTTKKPERTSPELELRRLVK